MTLQAGSFELIAAGNKGSDNRNLYIYGDHLGSAVLALDANQKEAMRLGYSPFGQVYRKQNDTKFWKLNSGVNANNQLNQLMPYQYTGRYTEGATGYTNLDARWYNPYTQRFNQPDYWSFNNTGLPKAVQHELLRFTGLNTAQLLRDPSQQMRYGYVAGNALSWSDPMGLRLEPCGQLTVDERQLALRGENVTTNDLQNLLDDIAVLTESPGGFDIIREAVPAYEEKSDMGIHIALMTGSDYITPGSTDLIGMIEHDGQTAGLRDAGTIAVSAVPTPASVIKGISTVKTLIKVTSAIDKAGGTSPEKSAELLSFYGAQVQ